MSKSEKDLVVVETSIGVVRGLLGAVPVAGTFLTEAAFDIRSRIKQRRLEEFVSKLGDRLEKLEGNVHLDILKTEEFVDLFEDVTEKILKNRSQGKLQVFTDILATSMCKKSLDDAELSHLYLSVLESLTEVELQILTSLHTYAMAAEKKMKTEGKELDIMAIDYSQDTIWNIKKSDFQICFETLLSKGLAYDDSVGRWDTKPRTFMKPTPLAIGLVTFVKESQAFVSKSNG